MQKVREHGLSFFIYALNTGPHRIPIIGM